MSSLSSSQPNPLGTQHWWLTVVKLRSWQKNGNLVKNVYICIYVYIYIYVCVCVCVCDGRRLFIGERVLLKVCSTACVLTWCALVCVHARLLTTSCLFQCLGCEPSHCAPMKMAGLIGSPHVVGLTHAVVRRTASLLLTPVKPHLSMSHLPTDKLLYTQSYLWQNYISTRNHDVFIAGRAWVFSH